MSDSKGIISAAADAEDVELGSRMPPSSDLLVERLDSGDKPQHPAYIEEDIADEKKKILLERFDSGETPRDDFLVAQAQSDDISKKKILDDINQPSNTLNPPTPFNFVEHEDDNENEQIDIQMVNRKIGREVSAAQPIPTADDSTVPHTNRVNEEEDIVQLPTVAIRRDTDKTDDSATISPRSMIIQASVHRAVSLEQNVPVYQEQGEYAAIIPEAFLVEPEEDPKEVVEPIIISGEAELILPWYKQLRTYIFIGLFVIVVLGLGIGLGLKEPNIVDRTSEPSVSLQPSISPSEVPSYAPTISSAPSPVPTTLLKRLYNEQNVALNGTNMVMVTQNANLNIVFYSLQSNTMIPVSAFSEEDYYQDFTISINDTTSVLNFTNPTPPPTPRPTTWPTFSPTIRVGGSDDDDYVQVDCDVKDEYMLFIRDGDRLNSTWDLEDDTRCPLPSRDGAAYRPIGAAPPVPEPVIEVPSSDSSTSPWIIVISVLIPLLFCVLPLTIYVYLWYKRSNKEQAGDNNDETERMLALKCPVCSAVTDENYFLIPCGHFACAKCSAEYETQPCPTCHGTLTGRHKVTCKTSLA